jgi:translation initiation factor IF-2
MPENLVYMYLYEMHRRDVVARMNEVLAAGGEEALEKMPETDEARRLFLKIKRKQLEEEKKEGREIMKKFEAAEGRAH